MNAAVNAPILAVYIDGILRDTPASATQAQFNAAMLAKADRANADSDTIGAQSIIVWNAGGDEQMAAEGKCPASLLYFGDLRFVHPRMQPTIKQIYARLKGRKGCCIRPQRTIFAPAAATANQWVMVAPDSYKANMVALAKYASDTYGCTDFYCDSMYRTDGGRIGALTIQDAAKENPQFRFMLEDLEQLDQNGVQRDAQGQPLVAPWHQHQFFHTYLDGTIYPTPPVPPYPNAPHCQRFVWRERGIDGSNFDAAVAFVKAGGAIMTEAANPQVLAVYKATGN